MSFQQKIILLIGGASVLSMLFFLSKSLYQDYQLERELNHFTEQNKVIEEDIDILQSQIDYYNSENYKDKYAKEVLNKLNPGEKVLILNKDKENVLIPESEFLGEISKKEKSVFQKWKEYFFGKEDLESRTIK